MVSTRFQFTAQNPFVRLASASTVQELPYAPHPSLFDQCELLADLMTERNGRTDRASQVRLHVLDSRGIDHSHITTPMSLNPSTEDNDVFLGEHNEFAAKLASLAKPAITDDARQLTASPTLSNLAIHGFDPELKAMSRTLNGLYHVFVEEGTMDNLTLSAVRYRGKVDQAREQVLEKSYRYYDDYVKRVGHKPDIVGLFYYYQIMTVRELIEANTENIADILPALSEIFSAHELESSFLQSPFLWQSREDFDQLRAGALNMILPRLQNEILRHYQRTVRFNWSVAKKRKTLLNFMEGQGLISQNMLDPILGSQPWGFIGRPLARIRQIIYDRPLPSPYSMDHFLRWHSAENLQTRITELGMEQLCFSNRAEPARLSDMLPAPTEGEMEAARQWILDHSYALHDQFTEISSNEPDTVGLFYYVQILMVRDFMTSSADRIGNSIKNLRQIFTAHGISASFLDSQEWQKPDRLPLLKAKAFNIIQPHLERRLVDHYQRALRFNWSLVHDRRILLESALYSGILSESSLEAVFDGQPPKTLGRFMAFFRRIPARADARPGSMDHFLERMTDETRMLQLAPNGQRALPGGGQ